jgi:hypothetical protein
VFRSKVIFCDYGEIATCQQWRALTLLHATVSIPRSGLCFGVGKALPLRAESIDDLKLFVKHDPGQRFPPLPHHASGRRQ